MDGKVIDDLLHNLNEKFETKFNKLTVCKSKVHDYIGINIEYINKDYVKFTMYNFIEDVLKDARDDINGLLPWPSDSKLFKVDRNLPRLSVEDVDYFPRMTAQLLFVCK